MIKSRTVAACRAATFGSLAVARLLDNRLTVKPWRVLLLMLLALLLPVRGAVAAAMLCPPGSHGHVVVQGDDAQAMHAAHADHAGHHHDALPAQDHEPQGGDTRSDTCDVCASFCSVTPLVGELPSLPQPVVVSSLRFPAWSAPEPLFLSSGQDRPPRSL